MYLYKKVLCIFLFAFAIFINGTSQNEDSLLKTKRNLTNNKDSSKTKGLSILPKTSLDTITANSSQKKDSLAKQDSIIPSTNNNKGYAFLQEAPLLTNELYINKITSIKSVSSENEYLFYLLVFVVLILATIKLAFPKHLTNIFSIFFQTNYRQRQTKDQLLQDKLAHMGLMLVFVCSASIYMATLLNKNKLFSINFWQLLGISFLLLLVVYGLKYFFIQLLGVLFKQQEEITTNIYLVILIKKF